MGIRFKRAIYWKLENAALLRAKCAFHKQLNVLGCRVTGQVVVATPPAFCNDSVTFTNTAGHGTRVVQFFRRQEKPMHRLYYLVPLYSRIMPVLHIRA